MKKILIICLLFAMLFPVANEALGQYYRKDHYSLKEEKLLYILPGVTFSSTMLLRVGYVKEGFGGEILLKREIPQTSESKKSLDGSIRHRAVMAGLTWHPMTSLLFTGSIGYGVAGTYQAASSGNYELTKEKQGVEVGGFLSYIIGESGHIKGCISTGVSVLPIFDSDYSYVDVSFGIGVLYLLGY